MRWVIDLHAEWAAHDKRQVGFRPFLFVVLPDYAYFGKVESNNPAKFIASGRCSPALSPLHHG